MKSALFLTASEGVRLNSDYGQACVYGTSRDTCQTTIRTTSTARRANRKRQAKCRWHSAANQMQEMPSASQAWVALLASVGLWITSGNPPHRSIDFNPLLPAKLQSRWFPLAA